FSGTSGAAAFAFPALMTAYWRRATAPGIIAGMLAGAGTMLGLFALGWLHRFALSSGADPASSTLLGLVVWLLGPDKQIGMATPFRPYFVWGLEPVLWGLLLSAIAGVTVSLLTKPPTDDHVAYLFDDPK